MDKDCFRRLCFQVIGIDHFIKVGNGLTHSLSIHNLSIPSLKKLLVILRIFHLKMPES